MQSLALLATRSTLEDWVSAGDSKVLALSGAGSSQKGTAHETLEAMGSENYRLELPPLDSAGKR